MTLNAKHKRYVGIGNAIGEHASLGKTRDESSDKQALFWKEATKTLQSIIL